jgi:copper chaperone CopZ
MRLYHIAALMLATCVAVSTVSVVQAASSVGTFQVEIHAAEMCCKGCVQKVSAQLYAAPGVTSVEANLETRMVKVSVSQKKGATIEQLWQAVAVGAGGPDQLRTGSAIFTLTAPAEKAVANAASTSYVVVENLNEEGRPQQIAGKLYAIEGVQKVNADLQKNTLIITGGQLSPWAIIGAVANAQARPISVKGAYGEMKIEWIQNQQAFQSNNGGIQR